jgi:hypothetical protein
MEMLSARIVVLEAEKERTMIRVIRGHALEQAIQKQILPLHFAENPVQSNQGRRFMLF